MVVPMSEASADVLLGTRHVGLLFFDNEFTRFEYDDFVPGHPILGQTFEDDPARPRSARVEVPAWFANLLPEQDSPLRTMIASQAGVKPVRSYPILCYLGEDLPGAVRVLPRLGGSVEEPGTDGAGSADDTASLRFSLAGVQLKFSMVRTNRGLMLPASGRGGDWLVKLPDRRYESVPENEFSMLQWMTAIGIDVPQAELRTGSELVNLPPGLLGPKELVLAVSRFDRSPSGRVHMEDLAQVADVYPRQKYGGTSYDAIGRLIAKLCPADLQEYVRRLTAMVIMGNTDAHLKNWTLLYGDPMRPRLSPAYDFVCVTAYEDFVREGPTFRLGGADRFPLVTRDAFRRFADRVGLHEQEVIETVDRTVDALRSTWDPLLRDVPLPPAVADHLSRRLRELPLAQGR